MSGAPSKKSARARRSGAARRSAARRGASVDPRRHHWTFLSNHAHVLICLAGDPAIRLRDVAERIGITERAVLKIVADLESEGLVRRHREGRRNSYELNLDRPLRHPIESHHTVGELIDLILS